LRAARRSPTRARSVPVASSRKLPEVPLTNAALVARRHGPRAGRHRRKLTGSGKSRDWRRGPPAYSSSVQCWTSTGTHRWLGKPDLFRHTSAEYADVFALIYTCGSAGRRFHLRPRRSACWWMSYYADAIHAVLARVFTCPLKTSSGICRPVNPLQRNIHRNHRTRSSRKPTWSGLQLSARPSSAAFAQRITPNRHHSPGTARARARGDAVDSRTTGGPSAN
jgi:hypothetical protein